MLVVLDTLLFHFSLVLALLSCHVICNLLLESIHIRSTLLFDLGNLVGMSSLLGTCLVSVMLVFLFHLLDMLLVLFRHTSLNLLNLVL